MHARALTFRRSDVWDEEDEQCRKNWFSASNAMRVYSSYLDLDCDRNGMLSRREFAEYGMGTLTEVFVNRIFQECQTYNGEMDYK